LNRGRRRPSHILSQEGIRHHFPKTSIYPGFLQPLLGLANMQFWDRHDIDGCL
jgi:hypothetical protein